MNQNTTLDTREKIILFLKKVHLYKPIVKVCLTFYRIMGDKWIERVKAKQDKRLGEKVYSKVQRISEIIESIDMQQYKGKVYLFQYSFFDTKGERYISGGGERYACDLAAVIQKIGYKVFLIQIGDSSSEYEWKQKMNDITVIGVNATMMEYFKIIEMLPDVQLSIYSGYASWGRKLHRPNIIISHGITWDNPAADANVYAIKQILQSADQLVSVDTNTISWLRTTYAESLNKTEKKMVYIPNYTDLNVYYPIEKEDKERIKIIFPRRCSPERGFWLVSDILPRILEDHEEVIFEYVGFIHTADIGDKIDELKNKFQEE